MRRWNGWGDENTQYNFPPDTANFLEQVTGKGTPTQDITIADALRAIHLSDLHGISDSDQIRLSISLDPFDRLLHARGQSLPDWIAFVQDAFLVFLMRSPIRVQQSRFVNSLIS